MLLRRLPVLAALLLLLLSAARCRPPQSRSLLELPGRYPRTRTEPGASGPPGQEARNPDRGSRTHRGLESHSRDPRHKEKFIIHLTGPLYFNPKCRKHFNRLYHNTRDCTIPAYYKRCARLLTRLANSPRCTER